MSYIRQTAIVLRKKTVRQGDRWYTLLCEESGKIDVLVKSGAKTNSKLAGHLEPGIKTEVMLASGKAVMHLAGARLVDSYAGSSQDFDLLVIKLAALQTVNNLVYASEANTRIFPLLDDFLTILASNGFSLLQKQVLFHIFTMEALIGVGFSPNLTKAKEYKYFDLATANFLPQFRPNTFLIDRPLGKLINLFFSDQISWATKLNWLKKIKYDQIIFNKLQNLISSYYEYHIGVKLGYKIVNCNL